MKSKLILVATITSTMLFLTLLSSDLLLRVTGPVPVAPHLRVAAGYGNWLVFFDCEDPDPWFNGIIALSDEKGIILANGVRVQSTQDRSWHFGSRIDAARTRYVDAAGTTQLSTASLQLPGIFYLHHKWIDDSVFTLAFREWLLLALFGILPGLWLLTRIRRAWETEQQERNTEPRN